MTGPIPMSNETIASIVAETKRRTSEGTILHHTCALCGYACGWFQDGGLRYDNGCDCGMGRRTRPVEWDDVALALALNPHRIAPFLAGEPLFPGASR